MYLQLTNIPQAIPQKLRRRRLLRHITRYIKKKKGVTGGLEPPYKALRASALPLGHVTISFISYDSSYNKL